MAERIIKGKIEKWGEIKTGEKKDGSFWYKISLKLQGHKEWFNFFNDKPEDCKKLAESAPIGSEISFIEWQKEGSEYWNYKKDSLNIISKNSNIQKKEQTETNWDMKELREHRKQAIKNAIPLMKIEIKSIAEMENFVKNCERIIYDGMTIPTETKIQEEVISDEY
jgi:hypothetical protein